MTLTSVYHDLISLSSGLREHFWHIWRDSLQTFLRYHVHKPGIDVRSQWSWPLTRDYQILVSLSLNPSECFRQICKFLRIRKNWMNGCTYLHTYRCRTQKQPLTAAIASAEAWWENELKRPQDQNVSLFWLNIQQPYREKDVNVSPPAVYLIDHNALGDKVTGVILIYILRHFINLPFTR